jgi:FtsH-binding integral membrane protein
MTCDCETACSGLSTGPLLDFALLVSPSIVPTALFATSIIFLCFTISTMFADQRQYLYLGGTLMSLLSSLLILSLVNLFIRSSFLYDVYLYVGLAVMCGFICYDTALIIEKRRMGDEDYIGHALMLFIDFIDVFRHLVILLSRRESERSDRKKRRD